MRKLLVILCLILGCNPRNLNPPAPQLASSEVPPPPLPVEMFDELPPMFPEDTTERPFDDLRGKSPNWKEGNFELFSVKTKATDVHPTYIIVTPFGDRAYISLYDIGGQRGSRGINCGSMLNCRPRAAVIENNQAYLILRHQVYLYENRRFKLIFDKPQYQFSITDATNRKTFQASDRYGNPVGNLEFVGSAWQVRTTQIKPYKKGKSQRILSADGR